MMLGERKRRRFGYERSKGATKAREEKGGFVDVPRADFRKIEGGRAIVNGNQRSCYQDALINGTKALGVIVTKKDVYDNILPQKGDTAMGVVVDYALNELGISMNDTKVPSTIGCSPFRAKGGPEYALLTLTFGCFFVELRVSQDGKQDDRHAVLYNAGFVVPTPTGWENSKHYTSLKKAGYTPERIDLIRGAVIDNDKDTPIKFIEPSDREAPASARAVFASLFPFASRVTVVGAWLMSKSS